MCHSGSRRYVVRDSTMNTEFYISSHRTEEDHWDLHNSSIADGRIKRDLGQLTFPLPDNYTIVDTSVYGNNVLNDVLFYMLVINMALATVILIQAVSRLSNLGYHWWRGDSYRMSPPPTFPLGYGMAGPTLHINSTAPVTVQSGGVETDSASAPSPQTEMTVVTNTDEVSYGKCASGTTKFMK